MKKKLMAIILILVVLISVAVITLKKREFYQYLENNQIQVEELAFSLMKTFSNEALISITDYDMYYLSDRYESYEFYDDIKSILTRTTCQRISLYNGQDYSYVAFRLAPYAKNESKYLLFIEGEYRISQIRVMINEAYLNDIIQLSENWFEIRVFVPTSDNTGDGGITQKFRIGAFSQ